MSKLTQYAKVLSGAALILATGNAMAQSRPTDPSTLDVFQILVKKGVLTQDEANAALNEARQSAEQRKNVVRAPYLPESLRNEIKEEVKADVLGTARKENWAQPDALPTWLNRFTFSGDVRMRGERTSFSKTNNPYAIDVNAINSKGGISELAITPTIDTSNDRNRTRIRARFGVDAKVSESVKGGLRMVTGDPADSASNNQTLSPNFQRLSISLDRAFFKITPFKDEPLWKDSSVTLGKFDNPFFATEIMWDRDVQFDGAVVNSNIAMPKMAGAPELFMTAGAFPMEQFNSSTRNKVLYAAQIGSAFQATDGVKVRLGAAVYNFKNVQAKQNPIFQDTINVRINDETAPRRVQFGNSLVNIRNDNTVNNTVLFGLASKYEVAALTGRADFTLNKNLTFTLDGEALVNTGYNEKEVLEKAFITTFSESAKRAWHLRGTIGSQKVEAPGQWQSSIGWRRQGADSTLDLFTDSDFGLGGTDQQGFVVRGSYALAHGLTFDASWTSARQLKRDFIDPEDGIRKTFSPVDTDHVRLDLTYRF